MLNKLFDKAETYLMGKALLCDTCESNLCPRNSLLGRAFYAVRAVTR